MNFSYCSEGDLILQRKITYTTGSHINTNITTSFQGLRRAHDSGGCDDLHSKEGLTSSHYRLLNADNLSA